MVGDVTTLVLFVVAVILSLVLLGYIVGTASSFLNSRRNDESDTS